MNDPLGGNEHAANSTNNFNDSMDDDSNSNHPNNSENSINNPQVSNNLSNNLASSSHFEHHNGASGNGSGQDDNDPFAGKEFYRTYNAFLEVLCVSEKPYVLPI